MEESPRTYPAERTKAFVDAVVAIAMTLLILPLMDSAGDSSSAGESGATWLAQNSDRLVSFVLSFVIIAMFWISQHRMLDPVRRVTARLIWLLVAWMLSIVWLPVATALTGQMSSTDPVAKMLYIGGMTVTALLSVALHAYLLRHLGLGDLTAQSQRSGMAVDLSLACLFVLALAITLVFPRVGYYSMLILFASGPMQLLFRKLLGVTSYSPDAR